MSNTRAIVDLGRLCANARAFLAACPAGMRLMAVVKADAYGHGAVACARALASHGIDFFAVATIEEAVELREAGIVARILVFAQPFDDQVAAFERFGIDACLTSAEGVERVVSRHPRLASRSHIKIDTGMSRVGLQPEEVGAAAQTYRRSGLTPASVWTHLAHSFDRADPRSLSQFALFRRAVADAGLAGVPTHVLNTGGFVHHPAEREAGDAWARVGIGLYGLEAGNNGGPLGLAPVMQMRSRLLHVKRVAAGTGVSYNHTWRAPADTFIATVGAGYADGIPRLLSSRGFVGVAGRPGRYPVVGRVCMDMIMIDAGPEPGALAAGDEVVLFGDGGPAAEEVARWADTIAYEICTGIGRRVERQYVGA